MSGSGYTELVTPGVSCLLTGSTGQDTWSVATDSSRIPRSSPACGTRQGRGSRRNLPATSPPPTPQGRYGSEGPGRALFTRPRVPVSWLATIPRGRKDPSGVLHGQRCARFWRARHRPARSFPIPEHPNLAKPRLGHIFAIADEIGQATCVSPLAQQYQRVKECILGG
jgi:hypothetical protein